jgi:hypothetical protein
LLSGILSASDPSGSNLDASWPHAMESEAMALANQQGCQVSPRMVKILIQSSIQGIEAR